MPQATSQPRTIRWPKLFPWLLLAAGALVYANSLRGAFVFDDILQIVENPAIRSWHSPLFYLNDLRPLVTLSLTLNYQIGQLNVEGYHVFNLLVHLLVGLSLYALLLRTLGLMRYQPRSGVTAHGLAFAVTLLWLVHPLCTQAVTYVIQRAESMASLFYLLTLLTASFAMTSTGRVARGWSVLAGLCCLLGISTKQIVVTAPLLVFIYDRTFVSGSWWSAIKRNWWLYLCMGASWLLLLRLLSFGEALRGGESASAGFDVPTLHWLGYFLNQPSVITHYLALTLWPGTLCLDYDWPLRFDVATLLPAMILVVTMGVLSAFAVQRGHPLGVVGAAFFLILAPTSSFLPIADPAVEHRMYLPLAAALAGLVTATVALLDCGARLWRTDPDGRCVRPTLMFLLLAAALGLGWATRHRNADYHDPAVLWSKNVIATPGNAKAHLALGKARHSAGDIDGALESWTQASRLAPQFYVPVHNIGLVHHHKGDHATAVRYFLRSLGMPGTSYLSHLPLADAYAALRLDAPAERHYRRFLERRPGDLTGSNNYALLLARQERLPQAIEVIDLALRLHPESPVLWTRKGWFLEVMDQTSDAQRAYLRALELDPDHGGALCRAAELVAKQGALEQGLAWAQRAVELDPADHEARVVWAGLLNSAGRFEQAQEVLTPVVRAQPGHVLAWRGIGFAAARLGQLDRAAAALETAARIDASDAGTWVNLGEVRARQARWGEAEVAWSRAMQLRPWDRALGHRWVTALRSAGRVGDALRELRRMAQDESDTVALLMLVRELTTTADPSLRDPAEAMTLIQPLVEAVEREALDPATSVRVLDAAGAVHAALGRLPEARALAEQALRRAEQLGQPELIRSMEDTLSSYTSVGVDPPKEKGRR